MTAPAVACRAVRAKASGVSWVSAIKTSTYAYWRAQQQNPAYRAHYHEKLQQAMRAIRRDCV